MEEKKEDKKSHGTNKEKENKKRNWERTEKNKEFKYL